MKQIAKSGKKVLFVATKKQAKQVVAEKAQSVNMPYVIEDVYKRQEVIHFGLTSQDINNTSVPLSIKEALDLSLIHI